MDPVRLPVVPPTPLGVLPPGALTCAAQVDSSFLPSAAQFGLSKHSHMTFLINPGALRKSVSLKISARTRSPDGLLLLLSDAKQMDFAVVKLAGGKVTLSADLGKGPTSVTSPVSITDGLWHTVSAEVSRRSLALAVDGSKPGSASIRGNQLDVDRRLYLGGLPHAHATRRINVSSSFQGCVRSVHLNGAMLDLTKPASRHNVTSCFTDDQAGSYFDGSGHALFRKPNTALNLQVDGRSYITPNPYPQSTSAETKNPVYLGGYPVGVKQNCLSITTRFRGCLKKIQLIKSHLSDTLDLSSAHFLSGVTPDSCPVG
ncbi:hypothetical protein fugu_016312 [Takifugu bimaculatus]|uniref:Laminin G domain-containing protein n=1 Tax=Takifugu bimaculatus TaxID=433685 RepID=A0A4Z2BWT8_9TELE|nr:hypothetical protein fugu_016312 [Takifugu bimaculatus]